MARSLRASRGVVRRLPQLNATAKLVVNTARKTPLLVGAVATMLVEDPLLFSVQTARRLPMRMRQRLFLRRPTSSNLMRVLIEFLADEPERARSTLRELPANRPPSILEAELRIQLGLSTSSVSHSSTNARAAFAAGKIRGSAANCRPRLARHFAGEERVHRPGSGLVIDNQAEPEGKESTRSTNEIRVLHFLTNSLPWTRSGYTYRTQSVLRAQQASGITVFAATRLAYPTLIGRPWANKQDHVGTVTYERLEPHHLPVGTDARLHLQAKMLLRLIREHRPDVLHTTTNFHNGLTVDALSRATGLPWVYEMRGNMEQTWVARHPSERQAELLNSERYKLMTDRETELAARANHVVVLSELQRAEMIERGIDPDKITVIPNSVDEDLLAIRRNPSRAQADLGLSKGFWVGSVSALVDYEGFPDLMRAVALLHSQDIPVRLAIVGDGVALPTLRSLASILDIEDITAFPGRVSQDEALKWYSALDVFVIPRVSTEVTKSVTPMKGLQAMALGIPLVVSDLPALVEVAASQGQGIVVPPEDPSALARALRSLYENPSLLDRLSDAARIAASNLTWPAAGEAYRNIYKSLTSLA